MTIMQIAAFTNANTQIHRTDHLNTVVLTARVWSNDGSHYRSLSRIMMMDCMYATLATVKHGVAFRKVLLWWLYGFTQL